MGRHKVFDSPEKFGEIITNFMEYCTENKIYPSDYQLRIFSNIPYSTLYDYISGKEDKYKPYSEQYKKLVQFREDYLSQVAMSDPKKTTFAIFALKQNKNGGWIDRPTVDVKAKELTIKTDGLGKNPFD